MVNRTAPSSLVSRVSHPLAPRLLLAALVMAMWVAPPMAFADAPKVKVTNAGSGPKRALRYTPKVGDKRAMVMKMKMATAMKVGGNAAPKQKMPAMVSTIVATVAEVAANGNITYVFEYTKSELGDRKGVQPMVVKAMEKALGGLVGFKGRATISNTGVSLKVDMKVPAGADPMLKQTLETIRKSMKQMSVPLPTEPVGQGATWNVVSRLTEGFVTLTQTGKMTLVKLDGDQMILKMDITQAAKQQKIKHPSLPPGANVELLSLKGSGNGTTTQNLTHVVPLNSQVDTRHTIVMKTQAEGMPEMHMEMTTAIDMNLRSKADR